ncbi:hypothetical protein [Dyella sp.]|uniref:hypothetical protein n=1 Tax=Dyella sp. TaxID=1869338 RepID=UPI002ED23041
MRIFVLAVAVIAALVGWMYWHSLQLGDASIAEFYAMDTKSTVELDATTACALVADDFQGSGVSLVNGQAVRETMDKAKYCESARNAAERLRSVADAAHTPLSVQYKSHQDSVTYTSDHRGATIEVSYRVVVGRMHIDGKRIDQLVKRKGKVLLVGQDDRNTISLT